MRIPISSRFFHIAAAVFVVIGCLFFVVPLQGLFSEIGLDGALSERTLRFLPYAIGVLFLVSALALWFAEGIAAGIDAIISRIEKLSIRSFVTLLLAVALILRLIWVFAVPSVPYTDYAVYDGLAHNIVAGKGFVDDFTQSGGDAGSRAWRPPGLPYMLAAAYTVFGENLNVAKGVILVFSIGVVMMTYVLSRAIFGELAGRIAGLIVAFFPSLVAFTSILATEFPFSVFFLLLLWLIIKGKPWYLLILAGISFGLAALIRPTITAFAVIALIYFFLNSRSIRQSLLKTLTIVVVGLIIILPWTLRNYRVFGSFVLLTTNSGTVLWEGTQFTAAGDAAPGADQYCQGLNEVQCDQTMRQLAIQNILSNPIGYARYSVTKLIRMFVFDYETVVQATESTVDNWTMPNLVRQVLMTAAEVYYLAVAALTLLASVVLLQRRQWKHEYSLYWLIFLLWAGIHFVFHGESRYHIPLLPLMAGFAAVAITGLKTARQ